MQDIEDRAVAGSNTYISKIKIEYCFRCLGILKDPMSHEIIEIIRRDQGIALGD
jgi:hypothetical protein